MHSEKYPRSICLIHKPESEQQNDQVLLSEEIPEVQPLRVHQKMVYCEKIRNAYDQRHYDVNDCHAHRTPSLDLADIQRKPRAAAALISRGTEFQRTNKKTTDPLRR